MINFRLIVYRSAAVSKTPTLKIRRKLRIADSKGSITNNQWGIGERRLTPLHAVVTSG